MCVVTHILDYSLTFVNTKVDFFLKIGGEKGGRSI